MRIKLRRFAIGMAQKFLDHTQVDVAGHEMRGDGMPEKVTVDILRHLRLFASPLDRAPDILDRLPSGPH